MDAEEEPPVACKRERIASHLPELDRAWQIKEELRQWYATATVLAAEERLDAWRARVRQSGPEELRKALSAFVNWKPEILAFFRFLPTRISNGHVEGRRASLTAFSKPNNRILD